jgi:uncharacterized protein involved in outer membrane biogenesis
MNSVLMWIGGILVVVLCALFGAPYAIDWNAYRGSLEEEASRALGRQVRVVGEVAVRLLPSPYISLEGIRIADLPMEGFDPAGQPILKAEQLAIGLAIAPLMRGTLEATEISLIKPEISLRISPAGRGNWQLVKVDPSQLTLGYADVTLRTLNIRDGRLDIRTADGRPLASAEAVEGELQAQANTGPFKARLKGRLNGEQRELRVSTSVVEGQAIRVKAALRSLDTVSSLALDGTLSDIDQRIRVSGEITAKAAARLGEGSGARVGNEFDIKAGVDGDLNGVTLKDVAISFEREGQPQLIAGHASLKWSPAVAIQSELESRWLNLDQIAGRAEGLRPADAAGWLASLLAGAMPEQGSIDGRLTVDQVTLGGDIVSGVQLAVRSRNGAGSIEELRAKLPGGTEIELKGVERTERRGLAAQLSAHGVSLKRLIQWAGKGTGMPELEVDSAFVIRTPLLLGDDRLELSQIEAELGGLPVRGSLTYRWSARPELRLAIEGRRLVSAGLGLPKLTEGLGELAQRLAGAAPDVSPPRPGPASPVGRSWHDLSGLDLELLLRAGSLDDGVSLYRDVDVDLAVGRDGTTVRRLRLETPGGARLEAEGYVAAAGSPQATAIGWRASALQAGAAREMVGWLAPLLRRDHADSEVEELLPLHLAGLLTLGGAGPGIKSSRLTVDGAAADTRIRMEANLTGELGLWRQRPLDAQVNIAGRQSKAIARMFSGTFHAITGAEPAAAESSVAIRASGSVEQGLLTQISVEIPEIGLGFEGRVVKLGEPDQRGEGVLGLRASDARRLIGRSADRPASASALAGLFNVAMTGNTIELNSETATLGAATLAGRLSLDRSAAKPRLEGDLRIDRASIGDLLSLLTKSGTGSDGQRDVWSDRLFDTALMTAANGTLRASIERLVLDSGLEVAAATLDAELTGEGVVVRQLAGRALGGRLTASLRLQPATSDVAVNGAIVLAGARLEPGPQAVEGAAEGRLDAKLTLNGRGLSPRSLVQFATGTGELTLTDAALPGLSPGAVASAADRAMAADGAIDGVALVSALKAGLAESTIAIPSVRLSLELAGGTIKVGALGLDTPEASISNRTTIDAASLAFDSEWRFTPKGPAASGSKRGPLPAVTVVYDGALAKARTAEPRIFAEDLLREVAVRRMERDAEELERLRRLDEERARQEAERRRQIEEALEAQRQPLQESPTGPLIIQAPLPVPQASSPTIAAPPGPPLPRLVPQPQPALRSAPPQPSGPSAPAPADPGTGVFPRPPPPGRSG